MKERLSELDFWNNVYSRGRSSIYFPRPWKYRNQFEFDRIFSSLFHLNKSNKLLEMGAGGSIWLPYFARKFGFDVYGIDYSKRGCDIAKKNLNLSCVKGHIVCNDFAKAKDEWSGFFDVITSFGVIEHFSKPVEIIRMMVSLLKVDGLGLIITTVPNTVGHMMRIQKLIDSNVYNMHKIFSLKDLSNYHEQAGMHVILSRYLQFLDFSILNYQNIFEGKSYKHIAQGITGLNLLILYLQKAFRFFPQSRKLCSSAIVVAKREDI